MNFLFHTLMRIEMLLHLVQMSLQRGFKRLARGYSLTIHALQITKKMACCYNLGGVRRRFFVHIAGEKGFELLESP